MYCKNIWTNASEDKKEKIFSFCEGYKTFLTDSKTERDGESLIFPITPVVYVKDVDTTYFEGSCGSGTTACAAAFGLEKGEGIHHFVFPQPAGTIEATAVIAGGGAEKGYVE